MITEEAETPRIPFESGKRHLVKYRDENLYIFISENSLDMNMLDTDKSMKKDTDARTLVGLGIMSRLITLCLEFEIDKEVISGEIWTESRKKDDLADILSKILLEPTK